MEQRLMFTHTVEALFRRAFPGGVPARCRERLRQVGLDLDRPLLPAYPVQVWTAALEVTVAELFPALTREEAYRELGRLMVTGYAQTAIGRAMFSLSALLGPRQTLRRINRQLRSANNFNETHLTELGPGHCLLYIKQAVTVPTYYQGVLEAGLGVIGTRDVQVVPGAWDGEGIAYTVRWREEGRDARRNERAEPYPPPMP